MDHKVETGPEIMQGASTGGRRITLDPIRVLPVTLNIREVESTIPAGFQMEWGVIDDAPLGKLELFSGAGLGSAWATIQYGGKRYAISATELVEGFLNALEQSEEVRP